MDEEFWQHNYHNSNSIAISQHQPGNGTDTEETANSQVHLTTEATETPCSVSPDTKGWHQGSGVVSTPSGGLYHMYGASSQGMIPQVGIQYKRQIYI